MLLDAGGGALGRGGAGLGAQGEEEDVKLADAGGARDARLESENENKLLLS